MYKITFKHPLPRLPNKPFFRAMLYEIEFCGTVRVEVVASKDTTSPILYLKPSYDNSFIVDDSKVWNAIKAEIRARFDDDLKASR